MEPVYSNVLEINPQQLFSIMKEDIFKNYPIITLLNINKEYIEIRSQLINLIHKISKKMGFKSQTFFLSVYYLDIILIENKDINIKNFHLLSLSCFIVAAKYCENDPIVPPLENFLKLYNKYGSNLNINLKIKLEDLFETEVQILKYLNYNLHYVTIYDFDLFFFNHGIIKKQQIKDIINNNVNLNNNGKINKSDLSSNEDDDDYILDSAYIKKILEKIYKKSRFYLDLIIIKEKLCFKYNVLLLSIYIMKKSVEEIILNEYKLKNKDYYLNKRQIIKKTNAYFKEVMNNFYQIDYESNPKYQQLLKDKEIKNIFPQQEKIHEFKFKKLKNKNLTNLDKILSKNKIEKNEKENNNGIKTSTINLNGISNLVASPALEENQSPNININSLFLKEDNITQNNSRDKMIIKNIKTNNKLFEDYNKNNRIFYTKALGNKKFVKKNIKNKTNNNSNIDSTKNNLNSMEKNKTNCTFTQLKNNLKKNFSLNKKRCKDKYSHINNLKSLCKLSSCSNTIKNIKEGSFIKNKLFDGNHSQSPVQKILTEENEKTNDNINSDIEDCCNNRSIKNLRISKIGNVYNSKEKIGKLYSSLNSHNEKNDLSKSIKNYKDKDDNLNDNDNESFRSNGIKKKNIKMEKHKNLISIKYRTNIINENNDLCSNRNQPYFKKVIHNYEPMKKKMINKDNLKIYINNSLNKSNYNQNSTTKTTLSKINNYISLTNNANNSENKMELIKKRIISINKKSNLENFILYRSNNNLGAKVIKDLDNENNNSKQNLLYNDNNNLIKNTDPNTNENPNKIPRSLKSLKNIPTNIIYKNKPNNMTSNFRYTINQSPISFLKEIKELKINNDNTRTNNIAFNSNKDLVLSLKNISSTIENNCSYHRKQVFNSLNKKKNKNKNKIINKFVKNKTINNVRNSNDINFINLMKSEGNSFFNKYKNAFLLNAENNTLFNKKIINNPLNSFNTIDSTKNFNENNKTIENEHGKDNFQKQNNDESQAHQKIYSIMPNNA